MSEDRSLGWRDVLVPLLVLVIAVVEAVSYGPPRLPLVLGVEAFACALMVGRRRWPLVTAAAAILPLLGLSHVGPAVDVLAAPVLVMVLASFSLGRWVADLRGLAVLVPAYVLTVAGVERSDGNPPDITDVVFVAALLVPPYVFGRVMRTLDERSARLAAQAELLSRLQATVRDDAVAAERARIARELHDVLAHSISAMVVQASAGEELVRRDPDRAATAMAQVAETGRRALAETGRLLSLVRDDHDELGLDPDPGLDRLDELVDQFRRSGLDVEVHVDGDLDELSAGIDLSSYRIVQEALTNALKYSLDRRVELRLRRTSGSLVIEAENRGRPGPSTGSGLGLVGMAERVSVYGGTIEHEFTRDGRFRLAVVLPVEMADV
ncbi:MAG: histidine kinase [Mycobacteriales bacterium]|nr:histidine kinase [Mycobacteriales bacterium]